MKRLNGKRVGEMSAFCYLRYWFKYNEMHDLNVKKSDRGEKG